MATTSIGYDGSVDEIKWALLAPVLGKRYGVLGDGWKVAQIPNQDRQVSVSAGTGYALGVRDDTDAPYTLTGFATISAGSRWDLVVARRNWSTNTTSFAIVAGGAGKSLPSFTRFTSQGLIDEQPLALVQITATPTGGGAITNIVDLRLWVEAGGAFAHDELVLSYATEVGTTLRIGGDVWYRTVVGAASSWTKSTLSRISLFGGAAPLNGTPPAGTQFLIAAGTSVVLTDSSGVGHIDFTPPFPAGLQTFLPINGDTSVDRALGAAVTVGVVGGTAWGTGSRTRVSVYFRTASTYVANTNFRVNWIAIGW